MAKLILLITPLVERSHEIGEAWSAAGAPGVTYFESHGLHTMRQHSKSSTVLPGMMSLMEILRSNDENNITLLSIVPETAVDPIIAATESIVGPLDQPDNGILFVVDVERAVGLSDYS